MSPQLQSEVTASRVSGLAWGEDSRSVRIQIAGDGCGWSRPRALHGVYLQKPTLVLEVQPGLDSAEPDLDPVSWHSFT